MVERGDPPRPRGTVPTPAPVTCIVVADGGMRVLLATGEDGAGHVDAHDLTRMAALLENAAAALRGQAAPTVDVTESLAVLPRDDRARRQFRVGSLEIHPETRLVLRAGQPVPLSRIEFDLFLALARREGAPATRLELVREVWGFGAAVTSRSVDTQIYNLRHKLEENPSTPRHLLTVSGVGYRLAP